MKVVAGIIGGLILAAIGAILVGVAFAAYPEWGGRWGAISFLVIWLVGLGVAVRSPSAPKAWRRLLISAAVMSFLLPISAVFYTGSFMARHVDPNAKYAGAQAAGAAIGGGLVSGAMGFVGFFLGVVFLVIGLLVGRDKQIVYVRDSQQANG